MDIKFRIDKDTSFAFYVDYGDEPLTPLQQWARFAAAITSGLDNLRGDVNEILNGTDPQEVKDKAVSDLLIQENYANWINEQNEAIQQSGELPSVLAIDSKTIHGGIWIDAADDNKIKTGTIETFTANQTIDGSSIHVATLDGTPINLWISSNTGNPQTPQIKVSYYFASSTNVKYGFTCYNTNNYGKLKWRFGSENDYFESPEYTSESRNGYCCFVQAGFNNYTHDGFDNMANWSATTSPSFRESLTSTITDYTFTGGSVDPSAPWSFYNNSILPALAQDNAIFPNGYTP